MTSKTKLALGVLIGLFSAAMQPALAQTTLSKASKQVVVDGTLHGKWSHIANDQLPYASRHLYEDDEGALLVIRHERDVSTPVVAGEVSIEDVGSGEILSFTFDEPAKLVTVNFGGSQLVIDFNLVIAEMGEDGTQFPAAIKSAGLALISTGSQEFQDALHGLAIIGCYDSLDLYSTAILYAHLFYDTVKCDDPPAMQKAEVLSVVPNFDPNTTPPSPFEQQFGSAYFQ